MFPQAAEVTIKGPKPPVDFFVVVSLQTYADPSPPSGISVAPEIIGFPFIVLELTQEVASTNVRVFDQQMIYVKPEWNRPPYEVTTLQFAPNLLQGIRKFDAYVYAQFTQKNKSFCFVTDGPNDLMYVLRRESKLKGVRLAAYFDRFYDLGKEFEKFYPESNVHTLVDMATCVGVLKKGESAGLEVCKIISNILAVMLRENYDFPEPEVIPLSFDPFSPIPILGRKSGGGGGGGSSGALAPSGTVSGDDKSALSYKGAITGQQRPPKMESMTAVASSGGGNNNNSKAEESAPDTCVLRLRGLPWDASEEQLREFFAGLRVESVVWTFTHRNRPSGEAFVTFASVEEAAKGLGKHKEHLNKRYIEVFASSEAQAEAAQSQKRSDGQSGVSMSGGNASAAKHDGGDTHVMMYGLPHTVTVVDIEEFFEGFNFVPGSVEIDTDSSGRALGTGSINFKKAKDATRAIAERNRKFIGKRYVNLHQNAAKREQQRQAFLGGAGK